MMARRSNAGILAAGVFAVGMLGFAGSAAAQDKLQLGADTWLTTDYEFRGISQTQHNPAIQGEFTATYGKFYADIWSSSIDFGDNSPLEIDYYGGYTPTWAGINFDFGLLGYTYPDANADYDVLELKAAMSKTFMDDKLSVSYTTYYSPNADYWVFEGDSGYTFNKFWIFTPTLSGGIGGYDYQNGGNNYAYWDVGMTLGFASKYAVDLRYWDTSLSTNECGSNACDARIVGTLSASF
jgi:uncharacterized protein (TIGR02001 family)